MAFSNEELINLTAAQIQTMSRKELGELLVSLIQLCGRTVKRFDVTDGINRHVLGTVGEMSKNLDKLDKVVEIKTGMDYVSEKINTIGEKVNNLEYVKNKMIDMEHLASEFKDLDQRLSESINEMDKAQRNQQRFIEEMDAKSRRNNLVILGIPEETVASPLGLTDEDRVLQTLEKTGVNVSMDNLSLKRLGSSGTSSTPRPLLITLGNHKTCKEIVMNAKNLKYVSDCASIFIRRDTHPALRYEANRIRIREREEKADPMNSNSKIRYDRKERVLLKNGRIIDRFCPSFL